MTSYLCPLWSKDSPAILGQRRERRGGIETGKGGGRGGGEGDGGESEELTKRGKEGKEGEDPGGRQRVGEEERKRGRRNRETRRESGFDRVFRAFTLDGSLGAERD